MSFFFYLFSIDSEVGGGIFKHWVWTITKKLKFGVIESHVVVFGPLEYCTQVTLQLVTVMGIQNSSQESFVSSAKKDVWDNTFLSMSEMRTRKKRRLITNPCGTPDFTWTGTDEKPLTNALEKSR